MLIMATDDIYSSTIF